MKLRSRLIIGAVSPLIFGGLMFGAALPAFAAPGDTVTTFALTGGTLTLASAGTAALTNASAGTLDISGTLGDVVVTDNRGGTTNWTATASSTAFTGVLSSSSTAVTYTGGPVSVTGDITILDGALSGDITGAPTPVVFPSAVVGDNSATWDPTLHVAMPANALTDNYSGTVTTSVS